MVGKVLRILVPVSLGALVAVQWQEIARYLKIKRMSMGGGHPQSVPAIGHHAYPDRGGVPDGTGDFDSASRGGPAS